MILMIFFECADQINDNSCNEHDGNQNAENCKQKEQYYSSNENHCDFSVPGGKIQMEDVMLYLSGIGGVLFIVVVSLGIWRIGVTASG